MRCEDVTEGRSFPARGDVTAISGLGDKAKAGTIEVHVQVGDYFLVVQGSDLNITATEAVAKEAVAALR